MIDGFLEGISVILTSPFLIILTGVGVALGMAIGALPGLTATMGVALLLPLTFSMGADAGLLLLLGIYIGAIYGGSISAILLNTPGTPASAATAADGHAMVKKGQAGRALGISTFASFVGGVISVFFLMLISPILAQVALKFGSDEKFALAFFGLSIITTLSSNSMVKGLVAAFFGLTISMVGMDLQSGYPRFVFGNVNLLSGLSFIPILIGLFAFSKGLTGFKEIMQERDKGKIEHQKIDRVLPTKEDMKIIAPDVIRGGVLGTFIGSVPGAGADIGAYISYGEAKRWSKNPDEFGTGSPKGIAAAESGNNAVTGGAMIPLLTLGIPGDAVAAVMLGALTMQGLAPGPMLFIENIGLVYTVFIGMLIANIFMFLLGINGARVFSKVVNVPKHYLTPAILFLSIVGAYALNNSFFDVQVMILFGIIGYFFIEASVPFSPIIVALILGPMAEQNFQAALQISEGSFSVFFVNPITFTLIILGIITLFFPLLRKGISYIRENKLS